MVNRESDPGHGNSEGDSVPVPQDYLSLYDNELRTNPEQLPPSPSPSPITAKDVIIAATDWYHSSDTAAHRDTVTVGDAIRSLEERFQRSLTPEQRIVVRDRLTDKNTTAFERVTGVEVPFERDCSVCGRPFARKRAYWRHRERCRAYDRVASPGLTLVLPHLTPLFANLSDFHRVWIGECLELFRASENDPPAAPAAVAARRTNRRGETVVDDEATTMMSTVRPGDFGLRCRWCAAVATASFSRNYDRLTQGAALRSNAHFLQDGCPAIPEDTMERFKNSSRRAGKHSSVKTYMALVYSHYGMDNEAR